MSEPSSDGPPEPFLARARAFVLRNRSRLARVALFLVLFYAVTDLVGSTPREVELVLPLEDMLTEAIGSREGPPPAEVGVSILAEDAQGGLLSHAQVRLPEGLENLHHEVSFEPGHYVVVVEMDGVEPRRGSFEIPAEGAVRVHLSPEP